MAPEVLTCVSGKNATNKDITLSEVRLKQMVYVYVELFIFDSSVTLASRAALEYFCSDILLMR